MPRILLKTSLRYLLRHPWQIGLAILGVALGVAVIVSIDLANASALRAFTLSSEAVTGSATDQITGGPRGVDEALYRQLRVDLGLRDAAPVVDGYGAALEYSGLTLHVLGVDPLAENRVRSLTGGVSDDAPAFFTEPGAALLSAQTARAYGIAEGQRIRMRIGQRLVEAHVIGLVEPEDQQTGRALDGLMIVDISTAQEWFDRIGRLTRIDLVLPQGAAGDALRERIRASLPPDTQLVTPEARTNALAQMTGAFELNLTALSLLALIVGMFLIYNTITFSVVQRRGLIGTLRCLGVTRRQVCVLVLGEALAVGTLGALLGVLLGIVLGRGLVGMVTQTINDLYFAVTVRSVDIEPLPLVKGLLLGIAATLAAAAVPAIEATSTPARTVLRRSSYEERVRRIVPLVAAGGAALMAL
ncbi:MAG TPA: FtsX-like permease family protein, partial [Roseiflexaceae bacterium]|nr:FtsX-like permease family protein [Roseiflexaceae bacterium]